MSKILTALRQRLLTIVVWAVIILAIFLIVSYNRANQAKIETALASSNQAVRDATVLNLVQSDRLIDALTNTQNPNEDKDSPQNKKSVEIRKNAADSVNRLIAEKKISITQAFNDLFLLCKDPSDDVKNKAKDGLATLGSQSAANLDAIIRRLSDGDPDIRGAAVDALGRTQDGHLVINGTQAARAVNGRIQDQAAQDAAESAMVKIGTPAIPFLLPYVQDPAKYPDVTFRQKIADMLGQIGAGATSAVPTLTRVAATDPAVRRNALDSLANIVLAVYSADQNYKTNMAAYEKNKAKDPTAKPPGPGPSPADFAAVRTAEPTLMAALNNPHDDSEARAQAALALGHLATPAAVTALVKAMGDYDLRVGQAALQGIHWADGLAVGPLTAALGHGDEAARAAAAEALGGIGNGPAIAALQAVLADPATPPLVRQRAVFGLGNSNNVAVIPTLIKALGDPNGAVANVASESLDADALQSAAIPQLIAAFGRPTPVPFNASQTLARMGDRAVPALKQAVASSNPQMQTWAAVTLGATDTKDPNVARALTALAKSPTPSVRWASSQALVRLSRA